MDIGAQQLFFWGCPDGSYLYGCYVDVYTEGGCLSFNGWSRFQLRDSVHNEILQRAKKFKANNRAKAVTVVSRGRKLLSTDPEHDAYKNWAPSASLPEDTVV